MGKFKGLSLVSQSLRYKLRIGFMLMIVLPVIVFSYIIINYLIPNLKTSFEIKFLVTIFFIIGILAFLGFWIIREIVYKINQITKHAKSLADGKIDKMLNIDTQDEVGALCHSLNSITSNIRLNMDELKQYSEKTSQIHIEIQKRIMVISSLMQISSLASQGAKIDDILNLTLGKAKLLADSDAVYLLLKEDLKESFYMKLAEGINNQMLDMFRLDSQDEILNRFLKINKELWIDENHPWPVGIRSDFKQRINLRNTIAVPVYMKNKMVGILGIGNIKDDFSYKGDEKELLDIFSKQIAIIMENDLLFHRLEKLEIKDELTGLYNKVYIGDRLEEEIRRSINYQRPCSFVLFDINNFHRYSEEFGVLAAESLLKKTSILIRASIGEIDRVGRFDDDEFAVIFPEKNKRQAQEVAESIRVKLENSLANENKKITFTVGVSENPLDGISARELIQKADHIVKLTKQENKNRENIN